MSRPDSHAKLVGAGRFEPTTPLPNSPENRQTEGVCGNEANRAANVQPDHGLAAIVNAWPDLPGAMKAGIMAMVAAASKGQ